MMSALRLSGGSSPLARGLPAPDVDTGPVCGIIPARAGFTGPGLAGPADAQDHPRSRGVYIAADERGKKATGSSPLARGLQNIRILLAQGRRIIPARAGFTTPSGASPSSSGDHPRSRGVYRTRPWFKGSLRGSSPLARGLPLDVAQHPDLLGIIPARAGFTGRGGPGRAGCRDHPRSRGVYNLLTDPRLRDLGSSPLARGLPSSIISDPLGAGIIPARAGFTDQAAHLTPGVGDHPRSRGVY